jgi:hypothetical protein
MPSKVTPTFSKGVFFFRYSSAKATMPNANTEKPTKIKTEKFQSKV